MRSSLFVFVCGSIVSGPPTAAWMCPGTTSSVPTRCRHTLLSSSALASTTKHSNFISAPKVSALRRAQRLTQIVLDDLVGPMWVTLIKTGLPKTEEQWDEFWSEEDLAERLTLALEEMGPTAVKFGQSLSSRPDIVPRRLATSLSSLQEQMQPFDTTIAKRILQEEVGVISPNECESILSTLSEPVAAASIGCVYSALLSDQRKVAIKVQRPGIAHVVEQDAKLLLQVAQILEEIPSVNGRRLIQTDLKGAVEEFMNRLREELDFRNEAQNLGTFATLYSHRRNATGSTSSKINVVVPEVYLELCSKNVLVMEWIDATPLVDLETDESRRESYDLILQGIDCTFSQLLETGVLHADPHGGNLLKVPNPPTSASTSLTAPMLGYVDFGLLATIPNSVRDGLVCAVAELVFERNVTAVANLFGELALIPESVISDRKVMLALGRELQAALEDVLVYPGGGSPESTSRVASSSTVPNLRFDKLLNVLSRLVPAFQFKLPPYFLNNARALATLEGMAREIDPTFNVLRFLYPYALNRIVANPSGSPVVTETLEHLITNRETGKVERNKLQRLVRDMSLLTGFSKRKLVWDVLGSHKGRALVRRILRDQARIVPRGRKPRDSERFKTRTRKNRRPSSSGLFRL